jgi:hypothetical protein
MNLIQIPGTDVWVNPIHVTSVRHAERRDTDGPAYIIGAEVEYIGDAGYHTRRTVTRSSLDEVVAALNTK